MTRRLHLPRALLEGGRAPLPEEARHYLADVLRLGPGAPVEVFDGEGGLYDTALDETGAALVVRGRREAPPPAAPIALAFALAKGDKGDWVVQKATELGARWLLPFQAARSVVRLEGERARDRARRWERIAADAARQCGRAEIPEVRPPASLETVLASAPEGLARVVFDAGGEPLGALVRGSGGHLLIVGPEGGLTAEERALCAREGCRIASLGPRILRAETAAVTAVALVQFLAGDLGGSVRDGA